MSFEQRTVFPFLLYFMGDNPERHRISACADSNQTYHPCSACMVKRGCEMIDVNQKLVPRQMSEMQRACSNFHDAHKPGSVVTSAIKKRRAETKKDPKAAQFEGGAEQFLGLQRYNFLD